MIFLMMVLVFYL